MKRDPPVVRSSSPALIEVRLGQTVTIAIRSRSALREAGSYDCYGLNGIALYSVERGEGGHRLGVIHSDNLPALCPGIAGIER